MRTQDLVIGAFDAVIHAIPAGIDLIERDQLRRGPQRPSFGEQTRESGLSGSAATVDQDDRVRCLHGADSRRDPHDRLFERSRERVITS
ncbi:hypothetical protein GCM10023171_13750 [Microbacterium panaciterrae]|uniref:Uncharacterized protein n=1 Tax=Microbacterium panaciterrae TaxID=985759 RepID=A0ABP8PAB6_9MICO